MRQRGGRNDPAQSPDQSACTRERIVSIALATDNSYQRSAADKGAPKDDSNLQDQL
jgi:hypothetical protein